VRYKPYGLVPGFAITGVSIVWLIVWFFWDRQRQRQMLEDARAKASSALPGAL
jgi:heme exporter protein CcmD